MKESSLLRMILSLTLISAIAGGILVMVYQHTKGFINDSQTTNTQDAILKVLPGFDVTIGRIETTSCLLKGDRDSVQLHLAYLNEQLFGAAVETYTHKALNGSFTLMVGFDKEGAVLQTEVLKANESPGLGEKIDKKKSDFPLQFIGKSPENFKMEVEKDGGDVVAITGATISSRAFCDAVKRAHHAFMTVKKQNETEKNEQN